MTAKAAIYCRILKGPRLSANQGESRASLSRRVHISRSSSVG
jgi:hypothetical protein